MARKGLTKDGELVDVGAPGCAFQIDTDEKGADEFIKTIQAQAERRQANDGADEGELGAAIMGPTVEVRALAAVPPTTAGTKASTVVQISTESKLSPQQGPETGGALPSNEGAASTAVADPSTITDPSKLSGDTPPPATLSVEEQALVDEFGERVAEALIKAGFRSRAAAEAAADAALIAIPGVGPQTIKRLRGEEE